MTIVVSHIMYLAQYFMSIFAPSVKLIIMVSFCWMMLLICILPQPNFFGDKMVTLPSFHHLHAHGERQYLAQTFWQGYWWPRDVHFIAMLYGRLTMHIWKFEGNRICLSNAQLNFAQHRLDELVSFDQEKLSAKVGMWILRSKSQQWLWSIANISGHLLGIFSGLGHLEAVGNFLKANLNISN